MRVARAASVLVSLFLCGSMSVAAETFDIESRIAQVTVFADRAEITRSVDLNLPTGQHEIRFGNLPAGIDAESLTAKAFGASDLVIYGVRMNRQQLTETGNQRAREIELAIRRIDEQIQQFEDRIAVVQRQRQFLDSIRAASGEQIGKDLRTEMPSVETVSGLNDYLGNALAQTFQDEREAVNQIEERNREKDKLKRELADLSRGMQKQQSELMVNLEAASGGKYSLQVTYRIYGASWRPAYDLRADTSSGKIELVTYAVINQRTGEDWSEVPLAVSTAQPQLFGEMPEVNPWFLRPVPESPPAPPMAKRLMAGMVSEKKSEFAMQAMADTAMAEESRLVQASVVNQGPAVRFELPQEETVLSDGQPYKLPISTTSYDAEWLYVAAPEFFEKAYVRAELKQEGEIGLLAGRAAVFLDDAFMANTHIDETGPGETFEIDLGVDPRVKIRRRVLDRSEEVSLFPGFRGKTKTIQHAYLTIAENFTDRKIDLQVYDRVPVPQREEIKVDIDERFPKDVSEINEKPGVFYWQTAIEPGQKQEFKLSYRIRHPEDMRLPAHAY